MRRALLVLLLVPLLPTLLAPSPAYACSCASAPVQAYVDSSDVVVIGSVEKVVEIGIGDYGGDDIVRVDVQRVLKGEATATIDVVSHGCNGAALSPGMQGVIFLEREDAGLGAHHLALPLALGAGASLVLMAGLLWIRFRWTQ